MTPADVERVFGRGRLKMVTGEHVEVFREEALPGERRRYTKRFLSTTEGDFRHWTEREWRILARLVGHRIGPVPDVVQFDRGDTGRPALVQTYDAGITVDHWATLLPVQRDGHMLRHVFEDCAHWWALARHSVASLDAIHELQLVHLDLKADNICIPLGPADFTPDLESRVLYPQFSQMALIDFAFSLVSGEDLATALPIGHQVEYDYQSPRLLRALEAGRDGDLQPTRQLDWRCDVFSLAAMLRRHLPEAEAVEGNGWTEHRVEQAQSLVYRMFDAHHAALKTTRPHRQWMAIAEHVLSDSALAESLARGWQLAGEAVDMPIETPTPVTRIVVPVHAMRPVAPTYLQLAPRPAVRGERVHRWAWTLAAAAMGAISVPLLGEAWLAQRDAPRSVTSAEPAQLAAAALAPVKEDSASPSTFVAEPVAIEASEPAAETERAAASAPVAATPSVPIAASEVAPARPPAPAPASARKVRKAVRVATDPHAQSRAPISKKAVVTVRPIAKPSAAARTATPRTAPAPARAQVQAFAPAIAAPPVAIAPPASAPEPDTAPASVSMKSTIPEPLSKPTAPGVLDGAVRAAELPEDFSERADELLAHHIPRVAQKAERRVLHVLHVAARADASWQVASVIEATRTLRMPHDNALSDTPSAASDARRLNDAATAAFWSGRGAQRALILQLRAFGASPDDSEIAGNLAYYYLKQRPAQPELARQLAMYALTLDDSRFPNGRLEDWTTLAIASALAGRPRDAGNAWFVTLALSQSPDRSCRAAHAAYASHGERLKAPVEAMLSRINAWGRSQESTFCRWPPSWSARATTE